MYDIFPVIHILYNYNYDSVYSCRNSVHFLQHSCRNSVHFLPHFCRNFVHFLRHSCKKISIQIPARLIYILARKFSFLQENKYDSCKIQQDSRKKRSFFPPYTRNLTISCKIQQDLKQDIASLVCKIPVGYCRILQDGICWAASQHAPSVAVGGIFLTNLSLQYLLTIEAKVAKVIW